MMETRSAIPAVAPETPSAKRHVNLNQLMVVKNGVGEGRRSWAESLVDLPAGSLFSPITTATKEDYPTYATVQAGRDLHIQLNSDLVFINHSCEPTLEFDMERMEVRVARDRDLKQGDLLSFFYPSTEWTLAEPFDCWCGVGEGKCVGRIEGAANMGPEKLRQYYLNEHIRKMLERGANGHGVNGNGVNGNGGNRDDK